MATTCSPYHPSDEDAGLYWEQERLRAKSNATVPRGFPRKLVSPLVWTGSDVATEAHNWKLDLTREDIAGIEQALQGFEAQYEDLALISTSTFKLPEELSRRLAKITTQLYEGVGFQIVHGLDPTKYTDRQNVILYAGISSYFCPQRGQVDIDGRAVISHVVNIDNGKDDKELPKAPAFSNIALSFHTDNCEIMAFYYIEAASKGGQTLLASSWKIYNDLATKRPDVLQTLAEPWLLDTFKSYDRRPPRFVPLLEMLDDEKVLLRFSRYPVTGWRRQRNPNLPAPTSEQLEAIDAVHYTALKHAFQLPTTKGDMVFVNDMAIMHARKEFEESAQNAKRHILKMFMRHPVKGWPIPASAEADWMNMYDLDPDDHTKQKVWNILYEPGSEDHGLGNG